MAPKDPKDPCSYVSGGTLCGANGKTVALTRDLAAGLCKI